MKMSQYLNTTACTIVRTIIMISHTNASVDHRAALGNSRSENESDSRQNERLSRESLSPCVQEATKIRSNASLARDLSHVAVEDELRSAWLEEETRDRTKRKETGRRGGQRRGRDRGKPGWKLKSLVSDGLGPWRQVPRVVRGEK